MIAAILALLVGVAIVPLVRERRLALAGVDGFVLTALAGLLLVHVVPESLYQAGLPAFAMLVVGLFLPQLLEREEEPTQHDEPHTEPWTVVAVASTGLLVHAFLDGGALATDALHGHGGTSALTLGVVLHRLPMGIVIGMLGARGHSRVAWGVALAVAVATAAGYAAGLEALPRIGLKGLAMLQALFAGTLGHVVLGRAPNLEDHSTSGRRASATGALLGILVTVALLFVHDDHGSHSVAQQAALAFSSLLLESAPALLIAFVGAGILTAVLRGEPLRWIGRGTSPVQALKGVLVGLPVPVCSCGVLPVYQSLVKRGVPAAAALAFLVATPELGIDALALSLPLLGAKLTVARLVAAAVVAWLVGLVVGHFFPSHAHGHHHHHDDPRPLAQRLRSGLWWSMTELADHLLPWMLVGLAIAALASPLLGAESLTSLPSWAMVPAAVLIGLPVYVCASGSTPIAAVLLHKGLSPGAALAFLLAGPATNATTFGVLRSEHGTRAAVAFGAAVAGAAMLAGFAVDAMALTTLAELPPIETAEHHGPLAWGSLGLLGLIALASLFRQGPRGWMGQLFGDEHDHAHDHDHSHSDDSCGHGHDCCA